MNDLAFRSAGELATAIAAKEVSSVELLDCYLTRLEQFDPRVNAIVACERGRRADPGEHTTEWREPVAG